MSFHNHNRSLRGLLASFLSNVSKISFVGSSLPSTHFYCFSKVCHRPILFQVLSVGETSELHHLVRIHKFCIESNNLHGFQPRFPAGLQEATQNQGLTSFWFLSQINFYKVNKRGRFVKF